MSDLDLRETLKLERLEVNLFRGVSPDPSLNRIYGGQVIAQSLLAAYETVEDRICHSLHCYFIRPGDPKIPIIFDVDHARDGKSFTTRRVVAIQHGQQIFNLAASFQVREEGVEHQSDMPATPPPEGFPDAADLAAELVAEPAARRRAGPLTPIEMRFVEPRFGQPGEKLAPNYRAWFRAREPIGDDERWHQAVMAYASDMGLLGAGIRPHGMAWHDPKFQSASLDHAMWFHRPTDCTQWHLYDMDSPSASGARAFNRGAIYRQDGTLVASTAQEGLVRYRRAD